MLFTPWVVTKELHKMNMMMTLWEQNSFLTRFRSTFGTLRFDEKSFFNTLSGFTPYWDYKPANAIRADSSGVYTNEKFSNLSTIDIIHLESDVIDGSVVDGLRQPIVYSFVLDKKAGFKVLCELETIHYRKLFKLVLNTINFYLEDHNNEEVDFIQETLTFTQQLIKSWTIKWAFKNFKLIVFALVKNTTQAQKTLLVR